MEHKMIEKIYNVVTGETKEIAYSKEQIAEVKANEERISADQMAKSEESAKRKALLEKLGITEEEAKLLLS
jgi:hypothetical protein